MASPIAGVLFLGLFGGSPNAGLPAHYLAADALPTPQCVVCGPTHRNRGTTPAAADALELSANLRQRRDVARRLLVAADEILGGDRTGITEERLQQFLDYAGV